MKWLRKLVNDGSGFMRAVLAGLAANAITAIIISLVALAGGWVKIGHETFKVAVIILFSIGGIAAVIWAAASASDYLEKRHSRNDSTVALAIFIGGVLLLLIIAPTIGEWLGFK